MFHHPYELSPVMPCPVQFQKLGSGINLTPKHQDLASVSLGVQEPEINRNKSKLISGARCRSGTDDRTPPPSGVEPCDHRTSHRLSLRDTRLFKKTREGNVFFGLLGFQTGLAANGSGGGDTLEFGAGAANLEGPLGGSCLWSYVVGEVCHEGDDKF